MFASNFIVSEPYLKHLRGQEKLSTFSQSAPTIFSGNTMTNYFCSTCGTLMYRRSTGYPGQYITRIGTIDDLNLHETLIKPTVEQYTANRVAWCSGVEGAVQVEDTARLRGGRLKL